MRYKPVSDVYEVTKADYHDADVLVWQKHIYNEAWCLDEAPVPKGCLLIGVPYLYMAGYFAMWENSNDSHRVRGAEPIIALIEAGVSLDRILEKLRNLEIDFECRKRWDESMAIMRDRERGCQIKICDWIEEHAKTERIMSTQNHPYWSLYYHTADQILNVMGMGPVDRTVYKPTVWSSTIPISPYEIRDLGWSVQPDANWNQYYERMVVKTWDEFRNG